MLYNCYNRGLNINYNIYIQKRHAKVLDVKKLQILATQRFPTAIIYASRLKEYYLNIPDTMY